MIRDLYYLPDCNGICDPDHKLTDITASRLDFEIPGYEKLQGSADESYKTLNHLLLTDRVHRDLTIDRFNPREELSRYTRTEDQIPDFTPFLRTMFDPSDGEAQQQVNLVQSARANFILESNKYNDPNFKTSQKYFSDSSEFDLGHPPMGTVVSNPNRLIATDKVAPSDL